MVKEKLFEILMQADNKDLEPLSDTLVRTVPHKVIEQPAQQLVMFQAEESVEKIDFNVGEILVTSAQIQVNDTIGYSMVLEDETEKAFNCALLMGIYEAGLPEASKVEALAGWLQDKQNSQLREEREIISSTRVNFEVMGGQDANIKHNVE